MNGAPTIPGIAPLLLEKLALGELTAAERALLAERFSPEQLEAMRADVRADDAAILQRLPAAVEARAIERKLRAAGREGRRRRSRQMVPFLFAAACACALLFNRPWAQQVGNTPEVLVKGQEPHLLVYRQQPGGFTRLQAKDVANRGDLVQIRYVAATYTHGVIVSIDGRGKVTLHFPASVGESTALSPRAEVALPYAFELDDAPGYERFYFIVARSPLDVPAILGKAGAPANRGAADVSNWDLPKAAVVSELTIRKGEHE